VSQPLTIPEFPPGGPWDTYVTFIIWLPLAFRLFFLAIPFRKVVMKLVPHTGWALKKIKQLPIKGLGLLALNETLAFLIPPLMVLSIRMFTDPFGWESWSEMNNTSIAVLFVLTLIWIFFDLLRIGKVRRMLIAIEKHDIDRIKKLADAGIKTRSWLRSFARKGKNIEETKSKLVKNSAKTVGYRLLRFRKLTPAGLLGSVALGASIEMARAGAGRISDAVDKKLQQEFENIAKVNTKHLIWLFIRDLFMGIAPLIVLALLPVIF